MVTTLRGLRINRVAHVDKGAGEGVQILLMKRAGEIDDSEYVTLTKRTWSADERKAAEASGAAMSGGKYPIESASDLEAAIHAVGRGKGSHAAIRAHIVARAKALGASDKIPADWTKSVGKRLAEFVKSVLPDFTLEQEAAIEKADVSAILAQDIDHDIKMFDEIVGEQSAREAMWNANSALGTSVCSIMEEDEVDAAGKLTLLQETLQEYTTHMLTLVGGALAKSSARTSEGDGKPMSEVAKALGLKEDATAEDIAKALADAAFGMNIAKMSDKHTAFMNKGKMPDGGKAAFAAMDADKRDAHMKANPLDADGDVDKSAGAIEKALKDGDAFRTPEGTVITKAEAGAVFAVLKSQNDARIADRAEIAKMRDATEIVEFTKRAAPFAEIAKADELGSLLHSISKADPKLADQVEALLKTANARIEKGALFSELGSGQRQISKALDAINAGAQQLVEKAAASGEKLTIEKARMRFRDANPDIAKQEREQQAARAAA